MNWTPEKIDELRERRAHHEPYASIAETMGLTIGQVAGKCRAVGIVNQKRVERPIFEAPEAQAIRYFDTCQWIEGAKCGAPVCDERINRRNNTAYCAAHHRRAYRI